MKEEVINITTQPIPSYAGYIDGILIVKSPKLFLIT